jgi:hypothetical protein
MVVVYGMFALPSKETVHWKVKVLPALPMKRGFPARACEAFPFPLPSHDVDGIRGPSFQPVAEGTLQPMIEVETVAHLQSKTYNVYLEPW